MLLWLYFQRFFMIVLYNNLLKNLYVIRVYCLVVFVSIAAVFYISSQDCDSLFKSICNYDINKMIDILDKDGTKTLQDAQDSDGNTLLIYASYRNKLECVKVLLEKYHANPNIVNDGKWSPLLYAVNKGYSDIINMLLWHGADAQIQDNEGFTALGCLCIFRSINADERDVNIDYDSVDKSILLLQNINLLKTSSFKDAVAHKEYGEITFRQLLAFPENTRHSFNKIISTLENYPNYLKSARAIPFFEQKYKELYDKYYLLFKNKALQAQKSSSFTDIEIIL